MFQHAKWYCPTELFGGLTNDELATNWAIPANDESRSYLYSSELPYLRFKAPPPQWMVN